MSRFFTFFAVAQVISSKNASRCVQASSGSAVFEKICSIKVKGRVSKVKVSTPTPRLEPLNEVRACPGLMSCVHFVDDVYETQIMSTFLSSYTSKLGDI